MKKLSLILAVILMAAMFVVPAGAEDYKILKGTPVIDGIVEPEYLKSGSVAITAEESNLEWCLLGDTTAEDSSTGIVYFLWDETCIYGAAMIQDKHLVNADYDEENWAEDCMELYPRYEGIGDGKLHIDAFGKWCFTGDGDVLFDGADVKYACTQDLENNSYVIEFAMPFEGGLEEGGLFAVALQLNSITSPTSYIDNEDVACSYGGSRADNNYYLVATSAFATESTEDTTADTTPDDPIPDTTPVVDTTPIDKAPETMDAGIVAAVAAIVSAAGYMIAKKK